MFNSHGISIYITPLQCKKSLSILENISFIQNSTLNVKCVASAIQRKVGKEASQSVSWHALPRAVRRTVNRLIKRGERLCRVKDLA